MKLIPRFAVLMPALLTLAACAPKPVSPPPAEPPSGPAVDVPAPTASGPRDEALRRWQASGPKAYAYTLEISCFCIHRGIYAVQVRDGQLVSVTDPASGAPSPESRVEWILTVDWLFEAMRQAESAGTPVRAAFDPTLGYPTEAEIGLLANDSGTLYKITNLRAL